ncbi:hypothetical protein P8452_37848 [Trifolium repens]|nr:hypothetical protein P8452_37848 [Trifolium repens]
MEKWRPLIKWYHGISLRIFIGIGRCCTHSSINSRNHVLGMGKCNSMTISSEWRSGVWGEAAWKVDGAAGEAAWEVDGVCQ